MSVEDGEVPGGNGFALRVEVFPCPHALAPVCLSDMPLCPSVCLPASARLSVSVRLAVSVLLRLAGL